MADPVKDPTPDDGAGEDQPGDDGIEVTDLSAEMPMSRLGPPWAKEPVPEVTVRGTAAELLISVFCMVVIFLVLQLGVGMNTLFSLVIGILVPLLYRGVGKEGRGRIRLTLKMWWDRRPW
jgi:hypothetical protein